MSGEKPPISISGPSPTRWVIVGVFVVVWFIAIILLYSDVVKVLAGRSWLVDLIVFLATVAVPVLAFFELRHAGEANRLRGEAVEQWREANRLSKENARLNAELDAERNKHLAQIAMNTAARTSAASLKIYPANRSRYILRQTGPGAHGDFNGGYFEFRLRIENTGNRNSTVAQYEISIREINREFDGIAPTLVNNVQGRHCQHALAPQNNLNETNLVRIAANDSTNVGSLWFFLPELTLEMFASAGLRMQGPERRFGNLHCRLTITDSNGISASEGFECHED
jgi:hypothetical protein